MFYSHTYTLLLVPAGQQQKKTVETQLLTVNIEVHYAANQGVKSNAEITMRAHYKPEQKYKRLNHSRLFSAFGQTSTRQKCFLLTMPLMDDYWPS